MANHAGLQEYRAGHRCEHDQGDINDPVDFLAAAAVFAIFEMLVVLASRRRPRCHMPASQNLLYEGVDALAQIDYRRICSNGSSAMPASRGCGAMSGGLNAFSVALRRFRVIVVLGDTPIPRTLPPIIIAGKEFRERIVR